MTFLPYTALAGADIAAAGESIGIGTGEHTCQQQWANESGVRVGVAAFGAVSRSKGY